MAAEEEGRASGLRMTTDEMATRRFKVYICTNALSTPPQCFTTPICSNFEHRLQPDRRACRKKKTVVLRDTFPSKA